MPNESDRPPEPPVPVFTHQDFALPARRRLPLGTDGGIYAETPLPLQAEAERLASTAPQAEPASHKVVADFPFGIEIGAGVGNLKGAAPSVAVADLGVEVAAAGRAAIDDRAILKRLDQFDALVTASRRFMPAVERWRAQRAGNQDGAAAKSVATEPNLTILNLEIAQGASTVLRLHFSGTKKQTAEALRLAADVLNQQETNLTKFALWMGGVGTVVLGNWLSELPHKLTPEQWNELAASIDGIAAFVSLALASLTGV